jgi:hypothetical protein
VNIVYKRHPRFLNRNILEPRVGLVPTLDLRDQTK